MQYKEIKGDLFDIDSNKYYLVQCISADFAMGAGIAVEFNKRFNVKNKLKSLVSNGINILPVWDNLSSLRGFCLLLEADHIFNLVTKRNYWNKPTPASIRDALNDLRWQCDDLGIKYLAMPRIGCGLDRQNWNNVSNLIKRIFDDSDIEIIVVNKD